MQIVTSSSPLIPKQAEFYFVHIIVFVNISVSIIISDILDAQAEYRSVNTNTLLMVVTLTLESTKSEGTFT